MVWVILEITLFFTLAPGPVFLSKNLDAILANSLGYLSYLGFLSISLSLSFKIFSKIVLLAKSLLSEYAASWAKQALLICSHTYALNCLFL